MDTGVVDENIESAEVFDGLLNCVCNLGFIGDIGLEEYPLRAEFFDLCDGCGCDIGLVIFAAKGCLSFIYDGDTRTFTRKFKCYAAPDTLTPAGYNANTILE